MLTTKLGARERNDHNDKYVVRVCEVGRPWPHGCMEVVIQMMICVRHAAPVCCLRMRVGSNQLTWINLLIVCRQAAGDLSQLENINLSADCLQTNNNRTIVLCVFAIFV